MNFRVIENYTHEIDYNGFKKDFLNPRIKVKDLRTKYDLNPKQYNHYKKIVLNETGIKQKPYLTMKNQTIPLIDNNTYIQRYKGDYYFIQKKLNGKRKSFGIYEDIQTARMVRNKLIENNWDTVLGEKLKKEYSITGLKKTANKKYPLFKELYKNTDNRESIQEKLKLTDYQYNHLKNKIEKEEELE